MATDPPPDPKARLLANPTSGYRPGVGLATAGLALAVADGIPPFTWLDVPRMVRDPQVQFALRMWRSPFQQVKWKVRAADPKVAKFVDRSLRRLWSKFLPKLLDRYCKYGFAAGAVEFRRRRGLVRVDRLQVVEPGDARPRVWKGGTAAGRFAGFTLRTDGGERWAGPAHAVWFAGQGEFGPYHDRAVMAGAFLPWVEKRGRNGAVHSRQQWFRKCSFSGGVMRHPDGQINTGTDDSPRLVDAQDYAREMLDYMEAGSVLTLTNALNPGDPGKYEWEYTPAEARADVAGVREYPQDLDKEILAGFGIPGEVLEASEVGSGWSGRAVPLKAYYGSVDELVGPLIDSLDGPIRYAVRANFGDQWYEIEPVSLVEQMEQAGKPGPGSGGPPATPDAPAPAAPTPPGPPAAPAEMSFREDDHPRDDHGRFVAKADIDAAQADPAKAAELRARVTDPAQRAKLDAQLGPPAKPPGKSTAGGPAPDAGPDGPAAPLAAVFRQHAAAVAAPADLARHAASLVGGLKEKFGADAPDPGDYLRAVADRLRHHIADRAPWLKDRPGTVLSGERLLDAAASDVLDDHHQAVATRKFADKYFDGETAADRAGEYLDAADRIDADRLDPDTRDAIADDLAAWGDPADLANHYATLAGQAVSDHAAVDIARAAAEKRQVPVAPFTGDPAGYAVVDTSQVDPRTAKHVAVLAGLSPRAAVPLGDGRFLVPRDDAANEWLDHDDLLTEGMEAHDLGTSEGHEFLWEGLATPRTVGERDVPASAKDTGTVSGNVAGATDAAADFDPDAADVYKRLDRDWYMVRRGNGNPDAEDKGRYGFVRRADVPLQVRLPQQYWAADARRADDDYDPDAVEATRTRRDKNESADGGRVKAAVGSAKAGYADRKRRLGDLRDRHNKLQGLARRADAQQQLADDLQSGSNTTLSYDPDDGTAHGAAAGELQGAIDDLAAAGAPDLPGFDLALDDPRGGAPFGDRDDEAGSYASANEGFDSDAEDHESAIDDAEQEHAEHFEDLAGRWAAVREAARKVVQTGAGSADQEARDNARFAAKAVRTADRALRKLRGEKGRPRQMSMLRPRPARKLSDGRGDPLHRKPSKLIALAMVTAALRAAKQGRPGAAAEVLDLLAQMSPEEVQRVLGPRSLSWVSYEGPRGGRGWKNTRTGRVVYGAGRPKPGERGEKAQASAKRASQLVSHALNHEATPEHLRELADHLPALNVAMLRSARLRLGASFGGARRRDAMVNALLAHVKERLAAPQPADAPDEPAAPKPLAGAAAKAAKRPDGTPHAPAVHDVHTVPVGSLKTDPGRFQYKVSGIGKEGVGQELKGVRTWNPELGGALLVWRDPADGQDYVVNGHHRHELASRLGAKDVNVRYIDAATAKEARARGALANIAEGRGTAVDAAKYLRDSGQDLDHLRKAGVSLAGKVAADAAVLTDLNDAAFQRVADGRLDEAKAVAVAKHLKDPALQEKLFKKLDDREEEGKDWSNREIETAARKLARAGKVTESGTDLFGGFEDEKSTWDQEVELESLVGRKLAEQVGNYAAVSSERRAAAVAGAGNTLNVGENQKRRLSAEQEQEVFHALADKVGPVAAAIKASAADLAAAKTKKEKDRVRAEAFDRVRDAIAGELAPRKPVAADAGGGGAGGGGDPGPARPAAGGPAPAGAVTDPRADESPLRDPYLSPDRQLDIFGGGTRAPRPAKPAVQPSLVPKEVEIADNTRRAEEAFGRIAAAAKDADGPDEAPDPADTAAELRDLVAARGGALSAVDRANAAEFLAKHDDAGRAAIAERLGVPAGSPEEMAAAIGAKPANPGAVTLPSGKTLPRQPADIADAVNLWADEHDRLSGRVDVADVAAAVGIDPMDVVRDYHSGPLKGRGSVYQSEDGGWVVEPKNPQTPPGVATPSQRAAIRSGIEKEFAAAVAAGGRQIPIHEIRDKVPSPDLASFDEELKGLWQDGKLRLFPITVLGNATKDQHNRSVRGLNETLFYAEPPAVQPDPDLDMGTEAMDAGKTGSPTTRRADNLDPAKRRADAVLPEIKPDPARPEETGFTGVAANGVEYRDGVPVKKQGETGSGKRSHVADLPPADRKAALDRIGGVKTRAFKGEDIGQDPLGDVGKIDPAKAAAAAPVAAPVPAPVPVPARIPTGTFSGNRPAAAAAPDKATFAARLAGVRSGAEPFAGLAADLAHDSVSRDDLTALGDKLGIKDQVKRLPKAKQIEAIRAALGGGA